MKWRYFSDFSMNAWLAVILVIILLSYSLEFLVSLLNLKALDPELPEEFKDVFDQKEYAKSQNYTRTTTRFSLIESSFTTSATLLFLLFGGFNLLDVFARGFGMGSIATGLIYTGSLVFLSMFFGLPFSLYSTFVIEEKFGFNRTSVKTFILDLMKTIFLTIIIGGPLLSLVLWFFEKAGSLAWIWCWIGVVIISIILQFLAPVLIMPLFNKFTPLEDGSLKNTILNYAEREHFRIQGIFTMDGSKRSTKLNAFFTGFGRFRKIVFFDTLIEKLSIEEIVAVLAHEMGHYKRHHLIKMIFASIFQTGIMFFFLSLVINNEGLFSAFGMEYISIYASLIFFGFLFSPCNILISIIFHIFSRFHEYEADLYAAESTGTQENLINALKTLTQTNLSNLTPHPLHVILHYSHPPVMERIKALRHIKFSSQP